jgi:hypothetical protein
MRHKLAASILLTTYLLAQPSHAFASTFLAKHEKVSTLPNCAISRTLTTKVSHELTRSLTTVANKYYQAKHLSPIKVNAINPVNLLLNYVGVHSCSNGVGAPQGSWSGSVPRRAKAAWILAITHKMNVFGNFHFIYVALVGSKFEVVGEGTSP